MKQHSKEGPSSEGPSSDVEVLKLQVELKKLELQCAVFKHSINELTASLEKGHEFTLKLGLALTTLQAAIGMNHPDMKEELTNAIQTMLNMKNPAEYIQHLAKNPDILDNFNIQDSDESEE